MDLYSSNFKEDHENSHTTDHLSLVSSKQYANQASQDLDYLSIQSPIMRTNFSDCLSPQSSLIKHKMKKLQGSYSSANLLLNSENNQCCIQHGMKIVFFCMTCQTEACQKCLGCLRKHRNHFFKRYTPSKQNRRNKFQECSLFIKSQLSKITSYLSKMKFRLQQMNEIRRDRIQILESRHRFRVDELVYKECQKLEQKINRISMVKSQLWAKNKKYEQLLKGLQRQHPIRILGSQGMLLQSEYKSQINQMEQFNPLDNISFIQSKDSLQGISFEIKNFEIMKDDKIQVISEIFEAYGSKWILKAYPAGFISLSSPTKMKQIQYLSLYVEMIDGKNQGLEHRVKISVVNSYNQEKSIMKEFKACYINGQSWGFDRYIRICNLYNKNLLSYSNSVKITVQIQLCNYFEASKMLSKEIDEKQRKKKQNDEKIFKLRKKIEEIELQKKKQLSQKQENARVIRLEAQKDRGEKMDKYYLSLYRRSENAPVKNTYRCPQISLQSPMSSKIIRLYSNSNSLLINSNQKYYHKRGNSSF